MNATQILKVAGIEKSKRTRILDREIILGEHEKIQGGYGRYQGTWVPFARAKELAVRLGVADLLAPLLEYLPGPNPQAQSPTSDTNHQSRSTSSNRLQISKGMTKQTSRQSLTDKRERPGSTPPRTNASEAGPSKRSRLNTPTRCKSNDSTGTPSSVIDHYSSTLGPHHTHPLAHPEQPAMVSQSRTPTLATAPAPSVITLNESSYLKKSHPTSKSHSANGPQTERNINALLAIFSHPTDGDDLLPQTSQQNSSPSIDLTEVLENPELDVNIPIDEHGHTALHWAASLAHLGLVRAFLSAGADVNRGNDSGETPLIRATAVTNNFERESFNQLLELLHPSLWTLDNQDRTVLHHICLNANTKDRAESSRYHLECIFEWIVNKHDGQFDSQFIDAVDLNGDTALNIAARVGNKDLVRMLLDVGADKTIGNNLGLKPLDFGVEGEEFPVDETKRTLRKDAGTSVPARTSRDIIASITCLFNSASEDFEQEIRGKNNSLESVRAQLKVATRRLTEQRRQIDLLKRDLDDRSLLELRLKKLRVAVAEEDAFDWTGRSELDGRPAQVGKSFEQKGVGSTLAGLPASQIQLDLEPDPYIPPENDVQTLIYLRRMESWYIRVLGLLRERIGKMKGCNLEQEAKYLKVIKSFIGNTCVNEMAIGLDTQGRRSQSGLLSPTLEEDSQARSDEAHDQVIKQDRQRSTAVDESVRRRSQIGDSQNKLEGRTSTVHHEISESQSDPLKPSVIDNKLLSQLMAAIESDGPELDLNRVAGFMQRVQSGLI